MNNVQRDCALFIARFKYNNCARTSDRERLQAEIKGQSPLKRGPNQSPTLLGNPSQIFFLIFSKVHFCNSFLFNSSFFLKKEKKSLFMVAQFPSPRPSLKQVFPHINAPDCSLIHRCRCLIFPSFICEISFIPLLESAVTETTWHPEALNFIRLNDPQSKNYP